jgi:E3 ubiquitin-protein ligase HUWE1
LAIKMGRSSGKGKDIIEEVKSDDESSASEEDDAVEDAEREETPDVYRHSALGIYTGVSL